MRKTAAGILIVIATAGLPLRSPAQSATAPGFEVASIKPCAPSDGPISGGRGGGGSRGLSTSPGRISVTCMTVTDLINVAYIQFGKDPLINDSVGPFDEKRIKGGPPWAYSTRYTIEAKADGTASPETMQGTMLRDLLEDRFQLKTHREIEEIPMYALTVAKSGIKMKPVAGGCTQYVIGMPYADPAVAPDGKPWCANRTRGRGPNWTLDSAGQDLSGLAKMLSQTLDRQVVDRTGLTGLFAFHLEFAKEENGRGRGGAPAPDPASDVPPGPSVFTAIEEQLGLKLVSDKGPHGVIAIENVDRPTEN